MTTLTFLEVPIANTGLVLVLLSNGLLMMERSPFFTPMFDIGDVSGAFDAHGFSLTEPDGTWKEYDYGVAYAYKEMPMLKAWLIQQKLQLI
jgi:hypothetical protein